MTAKIMRKGAQTLAGVFLLTAWLVAVPPARADAVERDAATWDFHGEAADLLAEVRGLSGRLSKEADELESYTRSGVGWQAHGDRLTRVKEHINEIGDRLERLQEIRHVTPPWQQHAISQITPVAAELASRTEMAIEHLSGESRHLSSPTYTDHLNTIADRADTLDDSVSAFVEYGETQKKLTELQEKLEIRSS